MSISTTVNVGQLIANLFNSGGGRWKTLPPTTSPAELWNSGEAAKEGREPL